MYVVCHQVSLSHQVWVYIPRCWELMPKNSRLLWFQILNTKPQKIIIKNGSWSDHQKENLSELNVQHNKPAYHNWPIFKKGSWGSPGGSAETVESESESAQCGSSCPSTKPSLLARLLEDYDYRGSWKGFSSRLIMTQELNHNVQSSLSNIWKGVWSPHDWSEFLSVLVGVGLRTNSSAHTVTLHTEWYHSDNDAETKKRVRENVHKLKLTIEYPPAIMLFLFFMNF